jgi:SAM-dependent methyltransferase
MQTIEKNTEVKREDVKEFYSKAASTLQPSLCCPTNYQAEDVSHIPVDVLKISYGCGSPVSKASIKEGETVEDPGAGGGIDSYIAAKTTGKNGKIIGIDMTDEMLSQAEKSRIYVEKNLGYSNIEFRKGLLEDIPVDSNSVDVIISNCVINLSILKHKVFEEIYRILKNHGRLVISDIVSDSEVPEEMRSDKKLWGECISGAETQKNLIETAKTTGFYGISIGHDYTWKEVNGFKFSSITFRGWKFTKGKECVYKGQHAIYKGPFLNVSDDDGHIYPVGEPVEICTDTATKLTRPPYAGSFIIIDTSKNGDEIIECGPKCC